MKHHRYDELDSLRGLASLSVVIHHCLLTFGIFYAAHQHKEISNDIVNLISNSPLHFFWGGHEAVILFFILSGFVLSLQFFFNSTYNYQNYIIKRVCRIYIPYMFSIILSAILFFLIKDQGIDGVSKWFSDMWAKPINPLAILSYILMLGYDNHNLNTATWSLVHEMRISIIFPFLMFALIKWNYKRSLTIGIGASIGISLIFHYIQELTTSANLAFLIDSFSYTFYYCSFFIIGAVLAKYRNQMKNLFNNLPSLTKVIFVILSIVLYTLEWSFPLLGKLKYNSDTFSTYYLEILFDFSTALGVIIIFLFSMHSAKVQKILKSTLFLFLGKISYSLYLVHTIVLLTFIYTIGVFLPLVIVVFMVPVFSVLLAMLTYKFVEKPSIELGKKLTKIRTSKKQMKLSA